MNYYLIAVLLLIPLVLFLISGIMTVIVFRQFRKADPDKKEYIQKRLKVFQILTIVFFVIVLLEVLYLWCLSRGIPPELA